MNQEVKGAAIALMSIFVFLLFIGWFSRWMTVSYYPRSGVYLETDTSFRRESELFPSRT